MRVLLQRVTYARVTVDRAVVGEIGAGLCALVGVARGDSAATAEKLAGRVWGLRVFDDPSGTMNLSAAQVGGAVLVVSQFTLYGDTSRGRRPSWLGAAPPEEARPVLQAFSAALREKGAVVAEGRFGADMLVELGNDGPVTLMLELGPHA
ncbi:MAG: D-aminoacyl-tRNA deacylase [Acidimicrobiales bacterium]